MKYLKNILGFHDSCEEQSLDIVSNEQVTVNFIIIVSSIALLYMIAFLLNGLNELSFYSGMFFLMFLGSGVLTKMKRHTLSKVNLIVVSQLSVIIFSCFTTKDAGVQNISIGIALFSMVLFDTKNKLSIFMCASSSVMVYLILTITNYAIVEPVLIGEKTFQYFQHSLFFELFFIDDIDQFNFKL